MVGKFLFRCPVDAFERTGGAQLARGARPYTAPVELATLELSGGHRLAHTGSGSCNRRMVATYNGCRDLRHPLGKGDNRLTTQLGHAPDYL